MPQIAIMRSEKLSSMGSVAGALQHCYRERETHNADANRTPENRHFAAKSVDEAMGKLRELLPEKRRKDAVLAVEYVLTASPEWWAKASKQEQDEFFKKSQEWLAEKYGVDRIITATIHRDETSPHLSAFVVPLTKDGRLSAKEFIGGRDLMSQDQTTFAKAVKHLGLERGVEGSKAKHTTIKSYYGRVNSPIHKTPPIVVPEPTLKERLDPKSYGERVASSVLEQIAPGWESLRTKALEFDAMTKRVKTLEERVRLETGKAEHFEKEVEAVRKSGQLLAETISAGGKPLEEMQEKLRRHYAEKERPDSVRSDETGLDR